MPHRPILRLARAVGSVAIVALLLVSAFPASGGPVPGFRALVVARHGAPAHFLARPGSAHGHPPPLGFGRAAGRAAKPLSSGDLYYTQEGMTIGQLNSSSATSTKRVSEYVKLVTSPYSTGYELNGLSASGDWWQIVVADNWPGCNSGFEEITEVWDNVQGSGPVNCNSNLTFSTGDQIEFTLYFSVAGNGCLLVRDLTTSKSNVDCQAQPDSGGTSWQFLSSISDSNGYYTGPMTETINTTTPGCPDYTVMPRLSYIYPNGTFITAYTPWSDEFDLSAASTCYTSTLGQYSIGRGDPTSYFVDTALGTGYGPHWEDGQNYSLVDPAYGFRFQTDPIAITGVGLTATSLTVTAGSVDNFTANVSGGVAPFHALWSLNSVLQPGPVNMTWSWRAVLAGTYRVVAYVIDRDSAVGGPSQALTITVPGPLNVGSVSANPSGGDDVGLAVSFNATISGGFGYWAVTWAGLPTGCVSVNASSVHCSPTGAGGSNVSLQVRDANGSVARSGALLYHVFPALGASVQSNVSAIDIGQRVTFVASVTGGSGGDVYAWSLPPGCSGRGSTVVCSPTTAGDLFAFVTVTDSAGGSITPIASVVTVNPALTAGWSAPKILADAGARVGVVANVNGGTNPLTFSWPGLPAGCATSGPVANCTIATPGTVSVSVVVTDAAGESAASGPVLLSVAPSPSVSLSTSGTNLTLGDSETFTAAPTGGNAPFFYVWTGLPSGCGSANAPILTCTPASAGTYSVTVAATDAVGVTVRSTSTFAVATPPAPQGPAGFTTVDAEIGLVLLVIVGAVATTALVARRRRGYK